MDCISTTRTSNTMLILHCCKHKRKHKYETEEMKMTAVMKVAILKQNKRVRAKDIKECDAILTEAWNQGINAQASKFTSGWMITIKR